MKRLSAIFLFTILALFLVSACSSGKKSRQGFIGRQFTDLAARDNGYFNARLIMTDNEKSLWEMQEDNYEEVIPIFKYGTQEQASGIQPAMDEVMKKTSLVIELHEKSKWIDDCYFLIGKANFYKRNYTEALTAFQYIISEYPAAKASGDKKKKGSKDDEEGATFIDKFKHQPVEHEASLWVARCLIELKKYDDALTVVSVLKSKPDFPEWLMAELYAVEADCYIKQSQYISAITPIQNSIEVLKDKKIISRYQFILAQLYELNHETDKAIAFYQSVIDGKPEYTMGFYAKLNMTKLTMDNYGVRGSETAEDLKALLKDEKYTEFYGLIYYVLADLALADKQRETGIEYLNKSVRTSVEDKQKSSSYLRLADLYYADPAYQMAYAYYDSTLAILQRDHARYNEIKNLHDGLKLLVEQLDIIDTEKKLQYWATLSDKELDKELEKILMEEEIQESLNNEIITPNAQTQGTLAGGTEGDYYFYNTALRSRGFTEFKKNWGTRKLEDNWRRSDKGSFDSNEEETADVDSLSGETIDLNKKGLKYDEVVASLPKSPEALAASNARIAAALYQAGIIYKDNFKNVVKAVGAFEDNVEHYPDNTFEVQSLYQLFVLTTGQDQSNYKNSILTKYPESTYAKIILDPDFLRQEEKKETALNTYYEETYNYLKDGNYPEVLIRSKMADSLFQPNPFKPQFEMLAALTLGTPDSIDQFKNTLQKIALKYPTHEVGIRAQEILDYLRRGSVMDDAENTPAINYTYKPDEEHYFMVVLSTVGKESTTLKNNIATFNASNFSGDNLKISSLLLGKDYSIVLIKSFPGVEKAMVYYETIGDNVPVYEGITIETITPIIISKSNYVLFFKSKDVGSYETFFQENYLKDK